MKYHKIIEFHLTPETHNTSGEKEFAHISNFKVLRMYIFLITIVSPPYLLDTSCLFHISKSESLIMHLKKLNPS